MKTYEQKVAYAASGCMRVIEAFAYQHHVKPADLYQQVANLCSDANKTSTRS